MKFKFSGYTFLGPFESSDELKNESGVYLVATDDGGKWKLLDCGGSVDVKSSIVGNPRQECWEEHSTGRLGLFVKYCENKGRELIAAEIRHDHKLPCE